MKRKGFFISLGLWVLFYILYLSTSNPNNLTTNLQVSLVWGTSPNSTSLVSEEISKPQREIFRELRSKTIKLSCNEITSNDDILKEYTKLDNEVYVQVLVWIYKNRSEECTNSMKISEQYLSSNQSLSNTSWEKGISKKDYSRYKLIKQKTYENTCVIDNLDIIFSYELNKSIDKKGVYKVLNKKIWDYWRSWLFTIHKETWWNILPIKWWEYYQSLGWKIIKASKYNELSYEEKSKYISVKEANDFQKLEKAYNLTSNLSTNVWYLKEVLKTWKPVLMELPMFFLDKNYSTDTNIYHAITIIDYEPSTNKLVFINTLTWKIERIKLDLLLQNEKYLTYPYRVFTFLDEINPNLFIN